MKQNIPLFRLLLVLGIVHAQLHAKVGRSVVSPELAEKSQKNVQRAVVTASLIDPLVAATTYTQESSNQGQSYQQAVVAYLKSNFASTLTLEGLRDAVYAVDPCYNQAIAAVLAGTPAQSAQAIAATINSKGYEKLLTALGGTFVAAPAVAGFDDYVVTAAAAFGVTISSQGKASVAYGIATDASGDLVQGIYQQAVVTYLNDAYVTGMQAQASLDALLVAAATGDPLYNQAIAALNAGINDPNGVPEVAIAGSVNGSQQLLAALQPGPYDPTSGQNPVLIENAFHQMSPNPGATVTIGGRKYSIPEEIVTAAAAFGVAVNENATTVDTVFTLFVPFGNVTGTLQALHFHQGDYSPTAGLVIGMSSLGVSSAADDRLRSYALAQAVPDAHGGLTLSPLAAQQTQINNITNQSNPLFEYADQGIAQLMLAAGQPLAMLNNDPAHVYYLPASSVASGGSRVLTNKKPDDLSVDYPLNTSAGQGNPINTVYDIAVTQAPTNIVANPYNAFFVAGSQNSAATLGVSAVAVLDTYLEPLQTDKLNDINHPELNRAVGIDLTDGAIVAYNADASFSSLAPDAVNLWWDDRYGKLFGTLKGVTPGASKDDLAYGLFQGLFEANDFKLQPIVELNQAVMTGGTTNQIAASIFGAASNGTSIPVINLTRPRTMHTSTGKDYLLVTGGVAVAGAAGGEQAWVNALPLLPVGIADAGKLAQIDDYSTVLGSAPYNTAQNPRVDRLSYTDTTIDLQQTPVVVGRHPAYLAAVESGSNSIAIPVSGTSYALPAGSVLAPGSIIAAHSFIGKGSYITTTSNGNAAIFTTNSTFSDDTIIDGIISSGFRLGAGTEFGLFTETTDKNAVAINAGVIEGRFKATAGSSLAQGSVIAKDSIVTTSAWLIDFVTPVQDVGTGMFFAKDSILAQGSSYKDSYPAADLAILMPTQYGYGTQCTLDGTEQSVLPINTFFSTAITGGSLVGGALQYVAATDTALPGGSLIGPDSVMRDLSVVADTFIIGDGVTVKQGATLPRTALFYEDASPAAYNYGAITGAPTTNIANNYVVLNWTGPGSGYTNADLSLNSGMKIAVPSDGIIATSWGLGKAYIPNGTILPPFTLFKQSPDAYAIAGAPAASASSLSAWGMLGAQTPNAGLVNDSSATYYELKTDQAIKIVPDGIITGSTTEPVTLPGGHYVPRYTLFKEAASAPFRYGDSIIGAPLEYTTVLGALKSEQWVLLKWTDAYDPANAMIVHATDGLAQENSAPIASGKLSTDYTLIDPEQQLKIPLDGILSSSGTYDLILVQGTLLPPGTFFFIPPGEDCSSFFSSAGSTIAAFDNASGVVAVTYKSTADVLVTTTIALPKGVFIRIPDTALANFMPCMPTMQGDIAVAANAFLSDTSAVNTLSAACQLSLPANTQQILGTDSALALPLSPGYDFGDFPGYVADAFAIASGSLKKGSKLTAGTVLAGVDLSSATTDAIFADGWIVGKDMQVPRSTLYARKDATTGIIDYFVLTWDGSFASSMDPAEATLSNDEFLCIPAEGLIKGSLAPYLNENIILPQFTLFQELPGAAVDYATLLGMPAAPQNALNPSGLPEWWLLAWNGSVVSQTVGNASTSWIYQLNNADAALKIVPDGVIRADPAYNIVLPATMILPPGTMFSNTSSVPQDYAVLFEGFDLSYDQEQLQAVAGGSSYSINGRVVVVTSKFLPSDTIITFPPSTVQNCAPRLSGGDGLSVDVSKVVTLTSDMKIIGGAVPSAIGKESLLTPDSTIQPCFSVPLGNLAIGTGGLQFLNDAFTVQGGALVYDRSGALKMQGMPLVVNQLPSPNPPTPFYPTEIEVGPGGCIVTESAAQALGTTALAAGSILSPGSGIGSTITLQGRLALDGGQLRSGSILAPGSVLGKKFILTDQLHLATDPLSIVTQELALAPVDSSNPFVINAQKNQMTLMRSSITDQSGIQVAARTHGLFLQQDWQTNAETELDDYGYCLIASDSVLADGSVIAAGSTLVSPNAAYGFSTSDMQVLGDEVHLALEGDRSVSNGVEAGVFKSRAVFDDYGKVRGWTPWRRVGGSTDATAYFGLNPNTNNLLYLTSPTGKGILDYATGFANPTVINPATATKLTTWTTGDNALDTAIMTAVPGEPDAEVSLHNGKSLGLLLQAYFGSGVANPGLYSLIDFDPDTPGFAAYDRRVQDPQFACMIATGYERVALIQTGIADVPSNNFVPTKEFVSGDNTFVFDANPEQRDCIAAPGLAGMGAITAAEWTRFSLKGPNYFLVGGQGGLAALSPGVNPVRLPQLTELTNSGFPGTGYNFTQLTYTTIGGIAHQSFRNVRAIIASPLDVGFFYVVTPDTIFAIPAYLDPFQQAVENGVDLPAKSCRVIASQSISQAYAAGQGSLLGVDGEFTDLLVLQDNFATNKIVLLIATTHGLFYSDPIDLNIFSGSDADVLSVVWNPVLAAPGLQEIKSGSGTLSLYAQMDLNARQYVEASTGLVSPDWDLLANAVTAVIGTSAGYAVTPETTAIFGVPGLGFGYQQALTYAKQVATAVGLPDSIVAQVTDTVMPQGAATGVMNAMATPGTTIDAVITSVMQDPVCGSYDHFSKMLMMAATIVADIAQKGTTPGSALDIIANLTDPAAQQTRTDIQALANAAAPTAPEQLLAVKGSYGPLASWFDNVAPTELKQAAAGLKTVLRLEPINLQSGKRLVENPADQFSFEGNINVYATDPSDNELRLYRLNVSQGAIVGLQEIESADSNGNVFPYFARLGAVSPTLLEDLDTNFYAALLSGNSIDMTIKNYGGVPNLMSPAQVNAVQGLGNYPRVLDAAGDFTASLVLPALKTAWNSASGALYLPTDDGSRVNE